MDPRDTTIRYQGASYTLTQLIQHLQGISNPRDRYSAQLEIRDQLLAAQEERKTSVANFFKYVQKHHTWIHLTKKDFESQRQRTIKVAKRERRTEDRGKTAYEGVVKDWGEKAKQLMDGKSSCYAIRLRTLSIAVPSMDEAINRVNKAMIARAIRCREHNRTWVPTPQSGDFVEAARTSDGLAITQSDMDRFGLVIGKLGILTEQRNTDT